MDQALIADAGGGFSVELEESAGAGYRWAPIALPDGMRLESDEVTAVGPAPGATRMRTFRFAAAKAGRHQLDFELRRPWEEQAIETRHLQVQVGA